MRYIDLMFTIYDIIMMYGFHSKTTHPKRNGKPSSCLNTTPCLCNALRELLRFAW